MGRWAHLGRVVVEAVESDGKQDGAEVEHEVADGGAPEVGPGGHGCVEPHQVGVGQLHGPLHGVVLGVVHRLDVLHLQGPTDSPPLAFQGRLVGRGPASDCGRQDDPSG